MNGIFLIVMVLGLLVIGGVVGIWALNVLFGLAIPYTFQTILASLIVFGSVGARKS